jgi:hypothetical protein
MHVCVDSLYFTIDDIVQCVQNLWRAWAKWKHTANPFPVMTTGISLCSNSHRKIPVMNTGSLQWEKGFPVMKTWFSLWELLHWENPVLALFWSCTGLQCMDENSKFFVLSNAFDQNNQKVLWPTWIFLVWTFWDTLVHLVPVSIALINCCIWLWFEP